MASIDLCVYGTPHGFDSHGVPPSLGKYCEDFYRTNRRGKMLMANRRPDGTTVYSFLVYDLVEVALRPHSFFGTSFTLRGNQYIPDLKRLYAIFDTSFDELVQGGHLLAPVAGKLKYTVEKFSAASDILNHYLGALLAKIGDIDTEYFDGSFVPNVSGQIALLNIGTPTAAMTDAFRKTQWVAVSPQFKQAEPSIELDLGDVEQLYQTNIERFAQMAVDRRVDDLRPLKALIAANSASRKMVATFHRQGDFDDEDNKKILGLLKRQDTLAANAASLERQLITPQTDESEARRDGEKTPPGKRQCPKCGRLLNASEFPQGSDVCRHCRKTGLLDFINQKVALVIVAVLAVAVTLVFTLGGNDEHKTEPAPEPSAEVSETDGKDAFEKALNDKRYAEARELIEKHNFGKDETDVLHNRFIEEAYRRLYSGEDITSFLNDNIWAKLSSEGLTEEIKSLLNEKRLYENILLKLQAPKMSAAEKRRLSGDIDNLAHLDVFGKSELSDKLRDIPDKRAEGGASATVPPRAQVENAMGGSTQEPTWVRYSECSSDYMPTAGRTKDITNKESTTLNVGVYYLVESNQPIKIKENAGCVALSDDKKSVRIYKKGKGGTVKLEIGGKTYTFAINFSAS